MLIRKITGRRHDVLSNRAHAVLRKGLLRAASSRPSARAGFHVPKFGEVAQGCWLNAAHRIREQVQLSRHADFDDEYMRLFRTPKVGPTCLRCRTKQKEMRHTLLFGCQGTSLRCTHLTLADVQASQVVRRTGSSSSPGLRRRRRRFCCGGCCCCCCCGGDICVRASLTFSLRQGVGKMIPGERFGWLKTRPRWRGEKKGNKKNRVPCVWRPSGGSVDVWGWRWHLWHSPESVSMRKFLLRLIRDQGGAKGHCFSRKEFDRSRRCCQRQI